MQKELILTEDGSHTLRVNEIDECYHSTHGAVQESMHIFIDSGLRGYLSVNGDKSEINVLEIGFGTGLNAFLTLIEAEKLKLKVNYTTLELYPLAADDAMRLNYPEVLCGDRTLFEKLHKCDISPLFSLHKCDISPFFSLHKIKADFTACELPGLYDVIYFDAFSPEKQPEMWSEAGFGRLYEKSNSGAVMTTYCAKGAVRRAMQSVGFIPERLPGPPGKREILRARKVGEVVQSAT